MLISYVLRSADIITPLCLLRLLHTSTSNFNFSSTPSRSDLSSIPLMAGSNPYHRRPLPDYFISSPLVALLYPFHQLLLRLRGPPRLPSPHAPIRVVCLSDTHTLEWPDVPDGDLLIHAGDLANDGSEIGRAHV